MPMPMPTPGASPNPTLPGAQAGSPPHPGGSPATAPGQGAGNSAAAVAAVKSSMPILYKALTAFPPGSKENKAVLSAIQALNPIFAESGDKALVPAAIQNMASAAKSGASLASAPAPGITGSPSPMSQAA